MVWAPWMGVLGKIICEDTMGQTQDKLDKNISCLLGDTLREECFPCVAKDKDSHRKREREKTFTKEATVWH